MKCYRVRITWNPNTEGQYNEDLIVLTDDINRKMHSIISGTDKWELITELESCMNWDGGQDCWLLPRMA